MLSQSSLLILIRHFDRGLRLLRRIPTSEHCWEKIVAHRGLEPDTFRLQSFRFPNWDTSADMWSEIYTYIITVQSYY